MGILQAIWYWWVKQAEALKAFSALFAIVGAITGAILLFFPSWRNQRVIALLVIAVVGGMIVLSPGEARSRIRTWLRSNCRWMALGVLAALTLALAFIAGRATVTPTSTTSTSTLIPSPSPTLQPTLIPFAKADRSGFNPEFDWFSGNVPNTRALGSTINDITLVAGPKADQWMTATTAPVLVYSGVTGTFEARVKVVCNPGVHFQAAGLGLRARSDIKTWWRISRVFDVVDNQGIWAVVTNAGTSKKELFVDYPASAVYLYVKHEQDKVYLGYSNDGRNPTWASDGYDLPRDLGLELFLVVVSSDNSGGFVANFSDFSLRK